MAGDRLPVGFESKRLVFFAYGWVCPLRLWVSSQYSPDTADILLPSSLSQAHYWCWDWSAGNRNFDQDLPIQAAQSPLRFEMRHAPKKDSID
jgi:hypothetical protein